MPSAVTQGFSLRGLRALSLKCCDHCLEILLFKKTLLIYIFLKRGEGRNKGRERHVNQLPLTLPQLGTWSTTQACALTGTQTSNLLVHRMALNPLSLTSQSLKFLIIVYLNLQEKSSGTMGHALGAWSLGSCVVSLPPPPWAEFLTTCSLIRKSNNPFPLHDSCCPLSW